jgi:hypothetical protein
MDVSSPHTLRQRPDSTWSRLLPRSIRRHFPGHLFNAAVTNFIASGNHRIDLPTVARSLTILVIYVIDAHSSLIVGNDILPLSSLA